MEPPRGDCVEAQVAPNVRHSERPSGLEHGCTPNRVHPRRKKSVVQDEQHVKTRSTNRESIEEVMTVAIQPQSVHAMEESYSFHESDDSIESRVEDEFPQPPADEFSQEVTEILIVLVNDGISVGAYTLDLVLPP